MLDRKECILWANRIVMRLMKYVRSGQLPPAYEGVEDFLYDFWPGMLPWTWPDIREVAACLLENRRWADIHVFFAQKYKFDLTEELRRGIRTWEQQHREDEGDEEKWKGNPMKTKLPKNVWFIVDKRTNLIIAQASTLADVARGIKEARRRGIPADARRPNPRTSKCEDCGHVHGPGYCAEVCKQCIEEERGERESTRNPPSREARRFISSKIRKLAHEGYRGAQRIAIAYAMARRKGLKTNPMDLMSHGGDYAVIDLGKSDMPFRYTVQLLEEGRPLEVPPGVHILVKGMTRQGARALADHLNRQHKRNPAFLRKGRRRRFFQVRRKNPTLAVMGANPPDAAGDDIEATWAEINYRRPDDPEGDNIVREHEFPDGFVATPLKDGGVLLRHPRGLNLWTRR